MTRFLRAIYAIVFLFFILAFHFANAQSTNPRLETFSSDSDLEGRFYLYTENYGRLANNQIDVWIASDVNAYDIAEGSGYPNIVPLLTVRTVDMYLAINKDSDPAMLERLEAAYRLVYNANNGVATAGP